MTQLFGRKLSLVVAPAEGNTGRDLSQLHCRFNVRRGDTQTPNSCTVRVYNLSKETATKLRNSPTSEFSRLILNAGYEGNYGLLFDGNIKYVIPGHEDAVTSYLDIIAADGDSAYNFAVVNSTLEAGSTSNDHIAAALFPMGQTSPTPVSPGYIPTFPMKYPRPRVMFGPARDVLREAAKANDCTWSVQDSYLQFVEQSAYLPDAPIVLTARTGLIGFPQQTQNGLLVTSLLNPQAKIGRRIQIDNASVQRFTPSLNSQASGSGPGQNENPTLNLDNDGFYRILWSEHSGDTRGEEWYTDMVTVALATPDPFSAIGRAGAADPSVVVIPNG